jgi:hypothetical protein
MAKLLYGNYSVKNHCCQRQHRPRLLTQDTAPEGDEGKTRFPMGAEKIIQEAKHGINRQD